MTGEIRVYHLLILALLNRFPVVIRNFDEHVSHNLNIIGVNLRQKNFA